MLDQNKLSKSYETIQGWMLVALPDLSLHELMAFAIIYDFSKDGESSYHGSREYMAAWLRCSKITVTRTLNKLSDLGLIERSEIRNGSKSYCKYHVSDKALSLNSPYQNDKGEVSDPYQNDKGEVSDPYQNDKGDPYQNVPQQSSKDNLGMEETSSLRSDVKKQASLRTQAEKTPKDLEEVKAYFIDRQSSTNEAEKFFDHFSSNGWKVGGRAPMKDWRAAARNWIRNNRNFKRSQTKNYAIQSPETDWDAWTKAHTMAPPKPLSLMEV